MQSQISDEPSMEFAPPSVLWNDGVSQLSTNPTFPDARTPSLLDSPLALHPSIVLTLPTPRVPQSPVFRPHSPITLDKYIQATSAENASTICLSTIPSLPSCDLQCLSQLDVRPPCRSCERQWLACKMWYQASDGGRRQRLTAPFIRPAESNTNLRAVMDFLGVPGGTESTGAVGLGLDSPDSDAPKELPFKVVPGPPEAHCGCNSCTRQLSCSAAGAARWRRRLRRASVQVGRGTLRAAVLLLSSLAPMTSALDASLNSSSASGGAAHSAQAAYPSVLLASTGSSCSVLACVTSSSRFVEHTR